MIPVSDVAAAIIARGSFDYHLSADSWLGDQLLAEDIPVTAASEETDRTLQVPERVIFTVPRLDHGMSWSPVADDHPLAARGQRLRVQLGVGIGNDGIEWFSRGEFLIQDAEVAGDIVTVTAVGLLTLIDEARLISPYQPTGTLAATLRGLIEPAITVEIDGALADRSVPSGINYDEDRLGAVHELLDAWPALASVTEEGFLSVVPAVQSTTPVLALTNGAGGTVIEATGSSTREGGFSVVVARGTAADGGQVQGVAYAPGPLALGGDFNPLPVPFFFQSPLLTSVAECAAAANTVLARKLRDSALTFTAQVVPNPTIQAGDVLTITTNDHTDQLCTVEALNLPYLPGDGDAMRLTLRSLDA